jgi:peroxiredoxin
LPAGALAPNFRLPSVHDGERSLGELLGRGLALVLVFVHPDCRACRSLLPELGRWQAALTDRLTITPVSSGRIANNRLACADHGIVEMLLQARSEVAHAYGVWSTPSALVIDPRGTVARSPVSGARAIEALIRVELRTNEEFGLPDVDRGTALEGPLE